MTSDNSHRSDVINVSIKHCQLFKDFKKFALKTNMRTKDRKYRKWLLDIGNGKLLDVPIPKKVRTNNIYETFENLNNKDQRIRSVILCATNQDTLRTNEKILKKTTRRYKDIQKHRHHHNNYGREQRRIILKLPDRIHQCYHTKWNATTQT